MYTYIINNRYIIYIYIYNLFHIIRGNCLESNTASIITLELPKYDNKK